MDEYTRLLTELRLYFELEDVVSSTDTISAFDLTQIMTEKYKELNSICCLDDFNSIPKDKSIKKIRFFKKKILDGMNKKQVKDIQIKANDKTAELVFCFGEPPMSDFLQIKKDLDKEQIYYGILCSNPEFISSNYDNIMKRFEIMDDFMRTFQENKNTDGVISFEQTQIFSDSFLKFELQCGLYREVGSHISVEPSEDPENIWKRKWYDRETIVEVAQARKEEILKKIPISVSELNIASQRIVQKAMVQSTEKPYIKKKTLE